jgi:hypothetical protein
LDYFFFLIPLGLGVFFGLFWYFFGLFWIFLGYFGFFCDLIGFFFKYGKIVLLSKKKSGLIRFIWITFFLIPLGLGVFFGLFWYFFGLFWYFFGMFLGYYWRCFGIKSDFWYYTIDLFFFKCLPLRVFGRQTRGQTVHTQPGGVFQLFFTVFRYDVRVRSGRYDFAQLFSLEKCCTKL